MKNSAKVLVALTAGIAAGGALGVAFAPGKGTETRKKWEEKMKKLQKLANGQCKKEKLLRPKEKLEFVLQKINGKLETYTAEENPKS